MEEEDEQRETCICQRWPMLVVALTFFVFGVVGMLVSYAMSQDKALEHKHHYGIVIDAGSSHTDIYIYRWPSDKRYQGTAKIRQIGFSICADVGISSFKDNPSQVNEIMKNCIEDFALLKIPKHSRHHTPIYLGATAGMRLLCARDNQSCHNILQNISHTLQKYKFDQKNGQISVLSGKEEGVYGWITVNLLTDRIPKKKSLEHIKTLGALDMGGASAEISFIPKQGTVLPRKFSSSVRLYGRNYTVYTHSFLCYGLKEVERRLLASLVQKSNYSSTVTNPCYPTGYERNETANELWLQPCSMKPRSSIFPTNQYKTYLFIGGSNYDECEKVVRGLFNETSCNYGTCSLDGVFQPNVTGKFIAYSGYAFVSKFFNVTEEDRINKLSESSKQFCNESWKNIQKEHPSVSVNFLPKNCFNAVYIYQILTHGFHFKKDSNRIKFKNKVKDKEVGWSLGLMVNASNLIPSEEPRSKISHEEFVFFVSLSVFVICFGVILCFCYSIKKCKTFNNKQYQPISTN